jgi:hypothetical protein
MDIYVKEVKFSLFIWTYVLRKWHFPYSYEYIFSGSEVIFIYMNLCVQEVKFSLFIWMHIFWMWSYPFSYECMCPRSDSENLHKACHNTAFITTNPTWPHPDSKPSAGDKPPELSHGRISGSEEGKWEYWYLPWQRLFWQKDRMLQKTGSSYIY